MLFQIFDESKMLKSIFLFSIILFCVYGWFTWMYVLHLPGARRECWIPWYELQMIVNCPLGAENGTQVLWESSKCS